MQQSWQPWQSEHDPTLKRREWIPGLYQTWPVTGLPFLSTCQHSAGEKEMVLRGWEKQVFPNFPLLEPNELNSPPCGILSCLDTQGQSKPLHSLFRLVAERGAQLPWDRALGRQWHKQGMYSLLPAVQDVPVLLGLAAPPPLPGRSHGTAVLHPLAAVTLRKHGIKYRRWGHGRGFLLEREARWKCRAGSSGCLAGCEHCDFGHGSLLPFIPFSYGVSTASPISV